MAVTSIIITPEWLLLYAKVFRRTHRDGLMELGTGSATTIDANATPNFPRNIPTARRVHFALERIISTHCLKFSNKSPLVPPRISLETFSIVSLLRRKKYIRGSPAWILICNPWTFTRLLGPITHHQRESGTPRASQYFPAVLETSISLITD